MISFEGILFRDAATEVIAGACMAAGVAVAFQVIPVNAPRLRYMLAVCASVLCCALPWLSLRVPGLSGPAPAVLVEHAVPGASRLLDKALHWDTVPLLLWVWCVVALLLMLREAISHVFSYRIRRSWQVAPPSLSSELGWPEHVPLYVDHWAGPSAIGWLRPTVVLSSRMLREIPPDAVRLIAKHELSHARWRDPAVHAILRVLRAGFWFSPALWWLTEQAHLEREAAADAWSIGQSAGREEVIAYASTLLQVAEWPANSPPVGAHAAKARFLERRLQRLFGSPPRCSRFRLVIGIAVASVGIAAGTAMAAWASDLRPMRIIHLGQACVLDSGGIHEPLACLSATQIEAAAIHSEQPRDPDGSPGTPGIMVTILVDEHGRVIRARATAGDRKPQRERAALEAARQWRFVPAKIGGRTTKAVGDLFFFGPIPAPRGWIPLR